MRCNLDFKMNLSEDTSLKYTVMQCRLRGMLSNPIWVVDNETGDKLRVVYAKTHVVFPNSKSLKPGDHLDITDWDNIKIILQQELYNYSSLKDLNIKSFVVTNLDYKNCDIAVAIALMRCIVPKLTIKGVDSINCKTDLLFQDGVIRSGLNGIIEDYSNRIIEDHNKREMFLNRYVKPVLFMEERSEIVQLFYESIEDTSTGNDAAYNFCITTDKIYKALLNIIKKYN